MRCKEHKDTGMIISECNSSLLENKKLKCKDDKNDIVLTLITATTTTKYN